MVAKPRIHLGVGKKQASGIAGISLVSGQLVDDSRVVYRNTVPFMGFMGVTAPGVHRLRHIRRRFKVKVEFGCGFLEHPGKSW